MLINLGKPSKLEQRNQRSLVLGRYVIMPLIKPTYYTAQVVAKMNGFPIVLLSKT